MNRCPSYGSGYILVFYVDVSLITNQLASEAVVIPVLYIESDVCKVVY